MIYREAGQIKTNYASDQQIFPITQDRYIFCTLFVFLVVVPPALGSDYLYEVILFPILALSLAALGLNILTGYCGQLSFGTGGFMAIGAYSAFKLMVIFPWMNVLLVFLLAGMIAAFFGILIGLPSLRVKGFYLLVTTLALQFFVEWAIGRIPWLRAYGPSGEGLSGEIFGVLVMGPSAPAERKYLLMLLIVTVLTLAAKNLVRGRIGRSWMAIRDMDVAAQLIGIRPFATKLLAFAVSSFYIGVGGAMYAMVYQGYVDPSGFELFAASLPILYMIIIGGLGSILGTYFGVAFMVVVPVILRNVFPAVGIEIASHVIQHIEFMLFGGLIMFILVVEPRGLAGLWQIVKEKLRLWPFPH
ncbi:MAG: branched-chain amino acid ABC transporter permease [Alphaproteobacteria bacterium]|nr:branched-chain amino acid ABC transporter permease [Alphaproteobacteria bacterium]